MNIQKVLEDIEKFDPEVYQRLGSRRTALSSVGKIGMKTALAAVPLALGSMFNKAYGKGMAHEQIVEVLNFALTLEYLEFEFYDRALSSSGLVTGRNRRAIEIIRKHEMQHVEFLRKTIMALGGTPVAKPMFDFTAGGRFPDWNTNEDTFYAIAQALEDTGVRAYKGQAPNLMSNDAVLTAALQIHSVEARHAAKIRLIRGQKGWITLDGPDGLPPMAANLVYEGEANTTHLGINLMTHPKTMRYSKESITQAFDEPLSKEQVLTIGGFFIVS
ncbi:hypothetical protein BH24BAC1_BH24BAC1_02290 [soil metagenome]